MRRRKYKPLPRWQVWTDKLVSIEEATRLIGCFRTQTVRFMRDGRIRWFILNEGPDVKVPKRILYMPDVMKMKRKRDAKVDVGEEVQ